MRLKVVYDNEAEEGYLADWGFSCHIEVGDENILFDTGGDGGILLHNMDKMGIVPSSISKVVLSHAHWDHIGGLPALMEEGPSLEVYALASFHESIKKRISSQAELVEVSGAMRICEGVHTTGELGTTTKEQSLVIGPGKRYVVTGCSHPGLGTILRAASSHGKVSGILGGLHGSTEFDLLEGMDLIAPCHCTMHKQEIAGRFPHAFRRVRVGTTIEFG
jgi:7,8-dihydropterin-6-yl-methyl-4-(beta-D-ribofuranosyl)aminobenzene 5'-phosphate synthase